MKIFSLIDELRTAHRDDQIVRKNGTVLMVPGTIPKAKHILFEGITQTMLDEFLISQYKNPFPKEYAEFLRYSNGASLFMYKIKSGEFEFAGSNLDILGLPRTAPYGRAADMEEPFDVRIEDLRRHKKIPNTWLKCGCYAYQYKFGGRADIFIDTETHRVYSCIVDEADVLEEWDTLDDCLCDIFIRASKSESEYDYGEGPSAAKGRAKKAPSRTRRSRTPEERPINGRNHDSTVNLKDKK
ncbi:MAG: SMI1/KNR4 family protein [Clostridia bacterium]|nr:SMI1/KNR4 family protein [Clostridia bacterium]